MSTTAFPTKQIRGVTEACFHLVDSESEMESRPDMTLVARRERLHRNMHVEMVVLEAAAQSLVDFPDAPWELRVLLAMQASDEARHAGLMLRRFEELGGTKGEFPVAAFEWAVSGMLDSVVGRIAIINRTFEAGLIDLLGRLRNVWREVGDDETAELMDGVLADEIVHVRFGNQWIKKMTERDPALLIKVAMAIRFLVSALEAVAPEEDGVVNVSGMEVDSDQRPVVDVEARLEAEFTEEEVKEVLRQAGFQSILPHRLVDEARA